MPIRLSGLNSGMDTDSMIKKIMDAERTKLKKIEDKKVTLEWKQDKWKDLNTKLYNLYTKQISPLRLSKAYDIKKASSSHENIAQVTAEGDASIGNHTLKVKEIATSRMLTGSKISLDGEKVTKETNLYELGVAVGTTFNITVNGRTESFDVEGDSTIQNFIDFAKRAGVNANFDDKYGRFYLSSKESGILKSFELTEDVAEGDPMEGLSALGLLTKEQALSAIPGEELDDGTILGPVLPQDYPVSSLATVTEARNASYTLDGIDYTSESNTVSTNGLKITMLSASNTEVRVGVTANVEDAYNKFKSFVKEYNELLKEMNKLYYADSSSKFKPLSKEEKEEMSEKEIEQWESKIKDSILRRDERLGSVLNSMKAALSSSVKINEKSYSLSHFGIMTSSDYHEKGLLHIFGDSEDGVYGSKEDRFKKALTENPDEAGKALQEIMDGLYKRMSDGMKGTGLSSAMTFYNDKEYKSLEETYKKQYNTMEDKLKKIEDKYYKQFAAMEKAMAKMNSQTNSLASMLGGR